MSLAPGKGLSGVDTALVQMRWRFQPGEQGNVLFVLGAKAQTPRGRLEY